MLRLRAFGIRALSRSLTIFTIPGLSMVAERAWLSLFRTRPLTPQEIAASALVHPAGLIPYQRVRIHQRSPLARLAARLTGRWVALATMHIIHYPGEGADLSVCVHELTHVGQYRTVGAVYMRQALEAHLSRDPYDYREAVRLRQEGVTFAGLSREQQAQLCEDYYRLLSGRRARYGAEIAVLEPFVEEWRRGEV